MKRTTLSAISISLDDNKTDNSKNVQVVPAKTTVKAKPTTVVNVITDADKVTVTQDRPKPIVKVKKYDDTITYAKAVKNNYLVGEPIKIKLKLKRDAYIYFWTISNDGKGYMILPNNFEAFNAYKKDTASGVVPTAPKEEIQTFISKDLIVIAKKEKFQYDIESFQIGVRTTQETTPHTATQVNINITH